MADISIPDTEYVIKLDTKLLTIGAFLQNIPQYFDRTKQQLSAWIIIHKPWT